MNKHETSSDKAEAETESEAQAEAKVEASITKQKKKRRDEKPSCARSYNFGRNEDRIPLIKTITCFQ